MGNVAFIKEPYGRLTSETCKVSNWNFQGFLFVFQLLQVKHPFPQIFQIFVVVPTFNSISRLWVRWLEWNAYKVPDLRKNCVNVTGPCSTKHVLFKIKNVFFFDLFFFSSLLILKLPWGQWYFIKILWRSVRFNWIHTVDDSHYIYL